MHHHNDLIICILYNVCCVSISIFDLHLEFKVASDELQFEVVSPKDTSMILVPSFTLNSATLNAILNH